MNSKKERSASKRHFWMLMTHSEQIPARRESTGTLHAECKKHGWRYRPTRFGLMTLNKVYGAWIICIAGQLSRLWARQSPFALMPAKPPIHPNNSCPVIPETFRHFIIDHNSVIILRNIEARLQELECKRQQLSQLRAPKWFRRWVPNTYISKAGNSEEKTEEKNYCECNLQRIERNYRKNNCSSKSRSTMARAVTTRTQLSKKDCKRKKLRNSWQSCAAKLWQSASQSTGACG